MCKNVGFRPAFEVLYNKKKGQGNIFPGRGNIYFKGEEIYSRGKGIYSRGKGIYSRGEGFKLDFDPTSSPLKLGDRCSISLETKCVLSLSFFLFSLFYSLYMSFSLAHSSFPFQSLALSLFKSFSF